MIASNKHNPVIIAVHPLAVASDYIVVVAFILKAEAAVPGDHQQRFMHVVCDTHLVHQEVEVTVNVPKTTICLASGNRNNVMFFINHGVMPPNKIQVHLADRLPPQRM